MKTAAKPQFGLVFRNLRQHGLLLESDPKLPSVCGLIAGEPRSGSWWSHALGPAIFRVNEQLADHVDVLITKLISGKVTFVHRKLWPQLLAVAAARAEWQTSGLSSDARDLLKIVDSRGSLRTDQLAWSSGSQAKPGVTARELEKRLLIHSEELHTESGAHAKVIETWQTWAIRIGFAPDRILPDDAQRQLQERIAALNEEFDARARLPWEAKAPTQPSAKKGGG